MLKTIFRKKPNTTKLGVTLAYLNIFVQVTYPTQASIRTGCRMLAPALNTRIISTQHLPALPPLALDEHDHRQTCTRKAQLQRIFDTAAEDRNPMHQIRKQKKVNRRITLSQAIATGRYSFVRFLLERSNQKQISKEDFFLALKGNDTEVISFLVAQDVKILQYTDQQQATPLHWVAGLGNTMLIPLFLKFIDINTEDKDGSIALMWAACKNGNQHVLKLLLDAGADTSRTITHGEYKGYSALDFAVRVAYDQRMAKLLEKAMRKKKARSHHRKYEWENSQQKNTDRVCPESHPPLNPEGIA